MAVSENGQIYVLEQPVKGKVFDRCGNFLFDFDIEEGFGTRGTESVSGIAVNSDLEIIISNNSKSEIVVLDPKGVLLFTLKLLGAQGVDVNEAGQIFVVNRNNNCVNVYDRCGNFLHSIGSGLTDIFGVAVNADGLVVVTQRTSKNVTIFE